MYRLNTPLQEVKGVGPTLAKQLLEQSLQTVRDLVLLTPLRYEDRSKLSTVSELVVGEVVTLTGSITQPRSSYRGRRSFQSAKFVDRTGSVKLLWFNNPHVVDRLQLGATFFVSGALSEKGSIVQPTIEVFKDDSIHTGRLVPIYSQIGRIPAGTRRRVLKEIIDHLAPITDPLDEEIVRHATVLPIQTALTQLHFPEEELAITQGRERLAFEELVELIQRSQARKKLWSALGNAVALPQPKTEAATSLPFTLTSAQVRAVSDIFQDLSQTVPMNRLLLGDVGSGKTAVAGLAAQHCLNHGHNACLIAPTQILAEQHAATCQRLFPEMNVTLVTAQTSAQVKKLLAARSAAKDAPASFFIGTHAVFSLLESLQPALLIYDEQHRFGVAQRSIAQKLTRQPHILTLTATPIPRTLLLSIFSHLSVSILDELPPGRKPVKSWLVPTEKRSDAYTWIAQQLQETQGQALMVCPFIDPSQTQALENVTAANELFQTVSHFFQEQAAQTGQTLRTALLHGRMTKTEQQRITSQLFQKEIDVLITTPIIEVGLDLPAASIIIIEAAERFGLASLHQLRGRVGRAGQQAYCLLFTTSTNPSTHERLHFFTKTTNGIELAEKDLQRRGAGDIFGTQQSGLDLLRFANWSNLELVTTAKTFTDLLQSTHRTWSSQLLHQELADEALTLAN